VRELEAIEFEPFSFYSKTLTAKEVFKPLVREEVKRREPEIPIEEIMGSLALLGIVSGETPQAIIEDKKKKRRFFLKEGQTSGGIFLKKIESDAVTVVYKEEEFGLSL
jgi:type II secretory pathway component PulC